MSKFETGSPRVSFQVVPGSNVTRLTALKSGTLYAVLMRGSYASRTTNVIQPGTTGVAMGQVPWASLSAETQATIAALQTETGVNYPNGYFVAGGSANTIRNIPTWNIDKASCQDTLTVLRVAVPDFNSAVPVYLAGIRMRISTDNGTTYGRFQDVTAPFQGGVNYATFSIPVPYDDTVLVEFQAMYKDGSFGRVTRPVVLTGVARPTNVPIAVPVIHSVAGSYAYSSKNNKLQLSVTVSTTPDPKSGSVVVQAVDASGKVRATQEVLNTVPGTPLSVVLDDVDPSVATYTINAYSSSAGKLSAPTPSAWTTSTATGYVPLKLDPAKVYLSEEIYRMGDGTLESRIRVKFEGALDAERTRGSIYIRNRTTTIAGDLPTFTGFNKVGMATGNFLTDAVVSGGTQQWDVVVLAVGKDGTEATFSSEQIKTVSIVQYANYVPLMQATPTVTVAGESSVIISGTYARPTGTPEPVKVRAYKSETSVLATDLIGEAVYVYLGNGNYSYTLTVPDLTPFSVGSNNYDITLRVLLENQGVSANATKTTVRVIRALPGAPTLSSATPYVKTVKAVVTGFAAMSAGVQSGHTGTGGNGTQITITPAKSAIQVEVSDPVTAGNAPTELVTNASVDPSTGVVTFNTSLNAASRSVRVRWATSFGNSAWSGAQVVTFPVDNIVDSTVPDLSPCVPRYTLNGDGSITITWTGATFGASGLGNYVIRRNTTNAAGTSVVVGTVTTNTNLTWTDFIDYARIGQTFYYFLEAVSAQGIKSAAPIAIKKASGNSYAVETVVAAISTDGAPANVTNVVVKGSQGGFEVRWDPVADRDLKNYLLEFSANGTFSDVITTAIDGTTYFQTLGSTAPKATADVYRWRVVARDFGGNQSGNYSNVAIPDNTNYGSVTDTAPNTPTSVAIASNQDGSITLTIAAAASLQGTYYRIVRKSWSTLAGWSEGTGGTVENDIQIPAPASGSITYRDTALKAGLFYNYRVYSRSKLGTESASFVFAAAPLGAIDTTAPTAPTIAVTPNRGISSVVVTPAEANGNVELWCNIGTTVWNAGTAVKVAESAVGTTANAVAFSIGEADAAAPVGRAWAARHIDSWGNVSGWSTAVSGTALNFLRADLIDADHIKAGTIGVDKLTVGSVQRQTLLGNGHFGSYNTYGDGMSGWTLGAGSSFNATAGNYTPFGSTIALSVCRFDRTTSGVLCEQTITVLPGQTYTVVGLVYNGSSVAPHPVVSLRVMALDGTTRISNASNNPSAGSIIPDFYRGAAGGVQTNNADQSTTTSGWNLIAYKVTVPAGVTQIRLQVAVESYTGGGTAYVYPGFLQMYSDTLVEASISADQVNQLKAVSYGGDVAGSYDALTVRSIQNRPVATTAPTDKQALAWDNSTSKYAPMSVATLLGYVPANKAGDTFVGNLGLGSGTAGATATPSYIDLGNNYSTGYTRDKLKIYLYNSGNEQYGFGIGPASDVQYHSNILHDFYISNSKVVSISAAAISAPRFDGSGAGLTGTAASLTVNWANVSGRPTATSAFTNDSGFLTSSGSIANATNAAQLGGMLASAYPGDAAMLGERNDWSTRAPRSGFYESSTAAHTNLPTGTGTGGFMHIINCQHSNTGNNFAMQLATSFGPGGGDAWSNLFWRSTGNDGTRPWYTIIDSNNIANYTAGFAKGLDNVSGYGGTVSMIDATWMRFNKSIWTAGNYIGTDGGVTSGYGGTSPNTAGGGIFSGRVGVGTATPASALHVKSSSSYYGMMKLESTVAGEVSINYRDLNGSDSNSWTVGKGTESGNDNFGWFWGGANRLTLSTAGALTAPGLIRGADVLATNDLWIDNYYGSSLVGSYDYTKYRGIYSMGTAYRPGKSGTTRDNHYGLAFAYEGYHGVPAGLGHVLAIANAGTVCAAIGAGMWTSGESTASKFNGSGAGLTGHASGFSANYATSAGYLATGAQNGRASFASNTANASPDYAAIEIREYNRAGAGTGAWGECPSIGFHWGARVYSHLGLLPDGVLAHLSSARDGFAPLRASEFLCANTAYGIKGNNGFFDTVDSGGASDQLELCYSQGTGVVIGQGNGTKFLKAGSVYSAGAYTGGVARSYGSLIVGGGKNGWAGVEFEAAGRTLMVSASSQGFYDESGVGWKWRFDSDGSLGVGTVPGSAVSGFVANASWATSAGTSNSTAAVATGAVTSGGSGWAYQRIQTNGSYWDIGKIDSHGSMLQFRPQGGDTRIDFSQDCTIRAYAYRGNQNVAGTGEAIYCPAGVYSTGTNWLYGQIITNNNQIVMGTATLSCGDVVAVNGLSKFTGRGSGAAVQLKDISNGLTYQLYVEAGVLKLIQV